MLSQNPSAMQGTSNSCTNGSSTPVEQHLRAQLELLQNHNTKLSTSAFSHGDTRLETLPRPASVNGFVPLAPRVPEASRLATTLNSEVETEAEAYIHPQLRAVPSDASIASMMPLVPPSSHTPTIAAPQPSPAPLAPAPAPQVLSPDDGSSTADGRKAKRELSQSKRAAQNRAAQRAFRQRKEGYIKKLEQQVREFSDIEQQFKNIQAEGYALREYVHLLQTRLADVHAEVPPPPANVNLSQTSAPPPPPPSIPSVTAPEQPQTSAAVGTPLEAVAQAVAGLTAQEQMVDRQVRYPSPFKQEPPEEDARSTEEINRQLNSEEASAPPPS